MWKFAGWDPSFGPLVEKCTVKTWGGMVQKRFRFLAAFITRGKKWSCPLAGWLTEGRAYRRRGVRGPTTQTWHTPLGRNSPFDLGLWRPSKGSKVSNSSNCVDRSPKGVFMIMQSFSTPSPMCSTTPSYKQAKLSGSHNSIHIWQYMHLICKIRYVRSTRL